MRKLIALILCMLLVVSMSVTAFATGVTIEGTSNTNDPSKGDVTVKITNSQGGDLNPDKIYKVEIAWAGLEFAVTADEAEWNVATQTYTLKNPVLDTTPGTVTVTNHSNAAVNISALFVTNTKESSTVGGVMATLSESDGKLATAAGADPLPALQYTVTPSGTPKDAPALTYTVDTITVTVEPVA